MTAGGIDDSALQGKISWIPLHNFTEASEEVHWKVVIDGVIIGNGQPMGSGSPAIMDTGASIVGFNIGSQIFASFIAALAQRTNVTTLTVAGLPPLPLVNCSQVPTLPDLTIAFSGQPFTLSPLDYVYTDRETLDLIAPNPGDVPLGSCIVGVAEMLLPFGDPGVPEVLLVGNNFLKAFYSIWDIENHRVGLAKLASSSCSSA